MRSALVVLAVLVGGKDGDKTSPADDSEPGASDDTAPVTDDTAADGLPRAIDGAVRVTLDGDPIEGAVVAQGGNPARWITDADGLATVTVDLRVYGELLLTASWPGARTGGVEFPLHREDVPAYLEDTLEIELKSFSDVDNPAYVFQDPGEPDRRFTTEQCAHCHIAFVDDWYSSAHREAAKRDTLHDLYAGAAAAFDSEASCDEAGGRWQTGTAPGTGEPAERCYVGDGVLPSLNPDCGDPCDDPDGSLEGAVTGACADCHAPAIDGELGGRDLLEAREHAFDFGVHCDLCHKVESIDWDADAGVAGRLRVLRPIEESPSPTLGDWYPLTFGPYDDVAHPRMGAVARDHFRQADFCGGCHELEVAPLVPGATADPARWPEGTLPLQTTFGEWQAGPYGDAAPCQSCHMPPDGDNGNSADLGLYVTEGEPGVATGWYRAPGEVRRHTWTGPRSPDSQMLQLAGALWVEAAWGDDGGGAVDVTVRNAGAGHALPTGEPMRHLVVLVEATCDGVAQPATGGDAVPDFGGWLDRREAGEDWSVWEGAAVGDVIRVTRLTGEWRDYSGYGVFGEGGFSAEDKGMPVEEVVGQASVTAVEDDGRVTLDAALPDGDFATRGEGGALPEDGDAVSARAGAPGFGFARVLAGADGARMVPHFLATDVVSDNRLMPQASATSSHQFSADCEDPVVEARLLYRPYAFGLARERGWDSAETLMAAATASPAAARSR